MLVFIEYTKGESTGKICYDVDSDLHGLIDINIPAWLKEDGVEFDSFRVTQVLESIINN